MDCEQGAFQPDQGKFVCVRLGGGHGAVIALQTAVLIQKGEDGGDVGVAAEPLGVGPDDGGVQQGENAVGPVAAPDAPQWSSTWCASRAHPAIPLRLLPTEE